MSSLTAQQLYCLDSVTEELVFVAVWEHSHRKSDDDEHDEHFRSVGHTGLATYLSADVFGISNPPKAERSALRARVLEKKKALMGKGVLSVDGPSVRVVLEAAEQMCVAKATPDPFDRSDNLRATACVILSTRIPGSFSTLKKHSPPAPSSSDTDECLDNTFDDYQPRKDSPCPPPSRLPGGSSTRETLSRAVKPNFGASSPSRSDEDSDEELADDGVAQARSRAGMSVEMADDERIRMGASKNEDKPAECAGGGSFLVIDGVRTSVEAGRGEAAGRRKGKTGKRMRNSEQGGAGGSRGGRTTTGPVDEGKRKKAKKRKLGTSLVSSTVTRASPFSDKPSNASFNDTLTDPLSLMPAPSSRKARRASSVGYGPYDPLMPFSLPRPRRKPAHSLPSSTPSSPSLSGGTKPRRSHGSRESSTYTIAALGGSVDVQEAEEEREQAVKKKKMDFGEKSVGSAVRRRGMERRSG